MATILSARLVARSSQCAQRVGIVEPQHLDVAGDQPQLLAGRDHLRQRRDMIAGEDIFVGERIGRAAACQVCRWCGAASLRPRPAVRGTWRKIRRNAAAPTCSNMPTETIRSNVPVDRAVIDQLEPTWSATPAASARWRATFSCSSDSVTPGRRPRRPCADRAPSRPSRSRCRARAGRASGAAWRRYAPSCRPAPAPGCSPGR